MRESFVNMSGRLQDVRGGSKLHFNMMEPAMNDHNEEGAEGAQQAESASSKIGWSARPPKSQLAKVVPTERVSFDKQMSVLRAYAAASGPSKNAVSNADVAAVVNDLAASSISLCNPFFSDVGLLIQEGRKQRPADAVFDYLHAYEWDEEKAALKLKDLFLRSWAATTLVPKLTFRQLSRDEAIQFLADEAKATKAHRKSLDLLIDFLNASGVVKADATTVSKAQSSGAADRQMPPAGNEQDGDPGAQEKQRRRTEAQEPDPKVERFTIPIPGKDPAVITVPRDLDAEDWDMLSLMIETYIKRLRGESTKGGKPS